jgi:CRP/FNR family cyclic AMP-dependent transcriptional regulator
MGLFDYDGSEAANALLSEFTFLADLSEGDWGRVLRIVETRHFKAGEDLIREGENDSSFFILTHGEVDVIVGGDDKETVLATIQEGSVFGEIAFFDDAPRSATIRARKRGSAVRISRENFENLAAWEPKIARRMLDELGQVLAMRLRWTTEQFQQ